MTQRFTGHEIASATEGSLVHDGPKGSIVTDSRAVQPGDWFLALVGEKFDGHAFLAEVAAKGVAGVVVDRRHANDAVVGGFAPTIGLVAVSDTTAAYQALGGAARDRVRGPVIGIGGAAGKTTTRALAALALSGLGKVHQNAANLNNHIGVPLTFLATPDDAAAVVIEMGTSGPGEMAVLDRCARPSVRLVVNVGPEHLEGLGNLDGVAREEGVMFASARPGDTLLVNLDDPYVRSWPRPAGTRVITWGSDAAADIRLVSADLDEATLATRARYATPTGDVTCVLPAPGVHIALNAAGALAAAWACGLDLTAAAAAMERYEPVGMRMRRESLGAITVLNDAYNANPPSMEASLRVLAALGGRKVAVLGDMLELGAEEHAWHEQVAAFAGGLGLDLVVLCGPRMSKALSACVGAGEVWAEADVGAVAARLGPALRDGDRILLKGSRGARMERILSALRGEKPAAGAH